MAESKEEPPICPCGFFGSLQTAGLCSKCYKEMLAKKECSGCVGQQQQQQQINESTKDLNNQSTKESINQLTEKSINPPTKSPTTNSINQPNNLISTKNNATITTTIITTTTTSTNSSSTKATTTVTINTGPAPIITTTPATPAADPSSPAIDSSPQVSLLQPPKEEDKNLDDNLNNKEKEKEKEGGGRLEVIEETRVPQKNRKRCFKCQCKLDYVAMEIGRCKCDYTFCEKHRLPEQHNCTYDHKDKGRKEARDKMISPKKHVGTSLRRLDSDS